MHNTVTHLSLSNALPIPEQWSTPSSWHPSGYTLIMVFWGVEYPSGQFGLGILAMLPPSLLCTCPLAEHETRRVLGLGWALSSNNKTLLCYPHYSHTKSKRALHQLLSRKWSLSQSEPGHWVNREIREHVFIFQYEIVTSSCLCGIAIGLEWIIINVLSVLEAHLYGLWMNSEW